MATRAQIRSRARIRADQDNSTFPTDAQYNEYIDEACKDVWYDLVGAGWPVSFSTVSLTLPSTTEIPNVVSLSVEAGVAVPVAFIRGVYLLQGGRYHPLPRLNEGDRGALYSTSSQCPMHYSVQHDLSNGLGVEFLPYTPGASVRIEYVKEHPGLPDDADEWRGPARSDELIVLRAAIKGVKKEGRNADAESLREEYREVWMKVTGMASWVDMRNPATIRDVNSKMRDPFDFDVVIE